MEERLYHTAEKPAIYTDGQTVHIIQEQMNTILFFLNMTK